MKNEHKLYKRLTASSISDNDTISINADVIYAPKILISINVNALGFQIQTAGI